MKFDISKVTRLFCKMGRGLKNAAPEIAIVGGVVGMVGAAVIACKETPKAMKQIEEHKEKMKIVDDSLENGVTAAGETYSEEDAKHDRTMILVQDGLQIVKTYAPALILATVSIVSILAGGKIFRKRVTALTSAYALLESRFGKYRDGVIEKFGADIDKELRYGVKNTLVEEKTTDENGNEKTEVKEAKTTTYNGYSDYARIFDETNPYWQKDGKFNLTFLQTRETWMCDKLRIKGVLFLNEVYEELGFERTPEGQLVGWVYDPSNPMTDNYVSFGLTDIYRDKDLVNNIMHNRERSFMLDFNCDGRILEKFAKFEKVPMTKVV